MKLIRNSESCKLLPEKRANSIFVESDDSFYLIGKKNLYKQHKFIKKGEGPEIATSMTFGG